MLPRPRRIRLCRTTFPQALLTIGVDLPPGTSLLDQLAKQPRHPRHGALRALRSQRTAQQLSAWHTQPLGKPHNRHAFSGYSPEAYCLLPPVSKHPRPSLGPIAMSWSTSALTHRELTQGSWLPRASGPPHSAFLGTLSGHHGGPQPPWITSPEESSCPRPTAGHTCVLLGALQWRGNLRPS